MSLSKNSGRFAIFTAAVLTACSLAGCGGVKQGFPAETYTIEKHDLKNTVNVSGTVSGTDLVKITSTVSARINKLNVGLGDYVKEGDVLCTFDDTLLREEYDRLKQNLDLSEEYDKKTHDSNVKKLNDAKKDKQTAINKAQKAINDAQNARDNAYNKYGDICGQYESAANHRDDMYNSMLIADNDSDRFYYQTEYEKASQQADTLEQTRDTLYDQLSQYDSAVDNARDAYNETVKQCDSAIQMCQEAIDNEKYQKEDTSKKELDKLKEQIDGCTITAPMDGIITSISVAEGNIPTTDAIMTIEDDSALKVSATIRESDILKVKNGMKAVVKTSATKDQEFIGEVTKVVNIFSSGDMGYYQQSEGGYTVEITVKNSENVFIGMNAKVEIILDEKKDVLAVPYDAITVDDDGNNIVYIAKEISNGTYKAEPVKVTKALETSYFIEIESADIKEGDLVVTSEEYMNKDAEFIVRTGGLSDDE